MYPARRRWRRIGHHWRGRCNNRRGCVHSGRGLSHNNRWGGLRHHDRRWSGFGGTHDIMHNRSRAKRSSGYTPSNSRMVMEPWPAMMHSRTGTSAMVKTPSRPRARTGECHSCRCYGYQHYYQFLVHVILLFLSLLTLSKAISPSKTDSLLKKKFPPEFLDPGSA